MRQTLDMHKRSRLALSFRKEYKPVQFQVPKLPPEPIIKTKERALPSMVESQPSFHQYDEQTRQHLTNFETYYDPLFNPHLQEERHRVDPNKEPFNAIYRDSQSEGADEYTKVRDITSPELWSCVEQLARIKVAPPVRRRKAGEPAKPLPSGFVPPPETPPDLPYFVPRTRNHLLPVYYHLSSDPNECKTSIRSISGDIWKLEEDLRTHLESLLGSNRRILSSVQEPDERIEFRGRYLHQVVDWLHAQGF